MASIFVSYSRRDSEFAERLLSELEAHQHDVWLDKSDIPPAARWREEITRAIGASDVFLFLLSPASISSDPCDAEVRYAVKLNKKIIVVLVRNTPGKDVPVEIAELNWIDMLDLGGFDTGLNQILKAVTTDLEYVRFHTRLLVRSLEWDEAGQTASTTLRGEELVAAETWVLNKDELEPAPTKLHKDFIAESRRTVTKRTRLTAAVGTVVAIAILVFGVLAYTANRNEARQQDVSNSLRLATQAQAAGPDNDLSIVLALEAVGISDPPAQARRALSEIAYRPGRQQEIKTDAKEVESMSITEDGLLSIFGPIGHAEQWNITDRTRLDTEQLVRSKTAPIDVKPLKTGGQGIVIASPDGVTEIELRAQIVAETPSVAMMIWKANEPSGVLIHRRIDGSKEIGRQVVQPVPTELTYSDDGQWLLIRTPHNQEAPEEIMVAAGANLYLWELQAGKLHGFGGKPLVTAAALSPMEEVFSTSKKQPMSVAIGTRNGQVRLIGLHPHVFGKSLTAVRRQDEPVTSLTFSGDGKTLASGYTSGKVDLWDVQIKREAEQEVGGLHRSVVHRHTMRVLPRAIHHVALSQSAKLGAFSAGDGSIGLYRFRHGAMQREFNYFHDPGFGSDSISALSFTNRGRYLDAMADNGELVGWSISDQGRGSRRLNEELDAMRIAAMASTGAVFLAGKLRGKARHFWLKDDQADEPDTLPPSPGADGQDPSEALAAALTADGRHLALAYQSGDLSLLRPDAAGSKALKARAKESALSLSVRADGSQVAAGHADGSLSIWDVGAGSVDNRQVANAGITSVALAPGGPGLLVGTGRGELIWTNGPGEPAVTVASVAGSSVVDISFDQDGSHAAVGIGDQVLVVDMAHRAVVRNFKTSSLARAVSFAPDGALFASGHKDGRVILWRMHSLSELVSWTQSNRHISEELMGEPKN